MTAVEPIIAPRFELRNLDIENGSSLRVFVILDDEIFCSDIDVWQAESAPIPGVRIDFGNRRGGEQPAYAWVALRAAGDSRVALFKTTKPLSLWYSPEGTFATTIAKVSASAPQTTVEINGDTVASDASLPAGARYVIKAQGEVAARTRFDVATAQASGSERFAAVSDWFSLRKLQDNREHWDERVLAKLHSSRWLESCPVVRADTRGGLAAPAPQSLTLKPSPPGVGGPLGGIRLVAGPCLDVGRPAQPHDARTPNYLPVAFSEVHDGSVGPGDSASSFAAFRIARDAHDGFSISARAARSDKSVRVAWVVSATVWERALASGSIDARWDGEEVLDQRATRLEVGNRILVGPVKWSRRVDRVSAIPLAWRVSAISSVGTVLQLESLTTLHKAGHAPETLFFVDRLGPPSQLASEPARTFPEFWLSEAGEWMITGPRTQGGPDVESSTSLNGKGALPADVARWLGGAYRIVS